MADRLRDALSAFELIPYGGKSSDQPPRRVLLAILLSRLVSITTSVGTTMATPT